jgi:hypothetical protein
MYKKFSPRGTNIERLQVPSAPNPAHRQTRLSQEANGRPYGIDHSERHYHCHSPLQQDRFRYQHVGDQCRPTGTRLEVAEIHHDVLSSLELMLVM